jgi:hypothetical protein
MESFRAAHEANQRKSSQGAATRRTALQQSRR